MVVTNYAVCWANKLMMMMLLLLCMLGVIEDRAQAVGRCWTASLDSVQWGSVLWESNRTRCTTSCRVAEPSTRYSTGRRRLWSSTARAASWCPSRRRRSVQPRPPSSRRCRPTSCRRDTSAERPSPTPCSTRRAIYAGCGSWRCFEQSLAKAWFPS